MVHFLYIQSKNVSKAENSKSEDKDKSREYNKVELYLGKDVWCVSVMCVWGFNLI